MLEMDKRNYQYAENILRFLRNELSEEEEKTFIAWLNQSERNKNLVEQFRGSSAQEDLKYLQSLHVEKAWKVHQKKLDNNLSRFNRLKWLAVAASIVAVCGTAYYFTARVAQTPTSEQSLQVRADRGNDIGPGGIKATLVLSDGQELDLDAALPESLKESDGTIITGGNKQELSYVAGEKAERTKLIMNKLVVPRAGTYQLTLSDGTHVWLNAESELEFPVRFGTDERTVMLKGEGFFVVAKDRERPFRVNANGTTIEALGTHFNVNAYADVKATLVEGAVMVSTGEDAEILKPGQQAVVSDRIAIRNASLTSVMAWKNGDFEFRKDKLDEIMDELARWYDIQVTYQGKSPSDILLTGSISRQSTLSEVLEVLSYASEATFSLSKQHVVVKF